MLRKITLPLVAAGFVFVGMFGASEEGTDAHTVAITPTMVPSPSPTATISPIPFEQLTPTPAETPTPPADDLSLPPKAHPQPTTSR